jgi:hypothetical protein
VRTCFPVRQLALDGFLERPAKHGPKWTVFWRQHKRQPKVLLRVEASSVPAVTHPVKGWIRIYGKARYLNYRADH